MTRGRAQASAASVLLAVLAALTAAAGTTARADQVPSLNVDPVCRGIAGQAATAGERGGPDLSFRQCVKSEMAMRRKLTRDWATFTAREKSTCIGSEMGGLASYTDLVTCLETAREARKFNN